MRRAVQHYFAATVGIFLAVGCSDWSKFIQLYYLPKYRMSISSSRGRSLTRSNKKRGRSYSRGASISLSSLNKQDGHTRRGWSYPSSGSMLFDPFPRRMRSILRYSQTFTLTSILPSIPVWQTFRAASIYDPDYTAVGHQPYGHDTLATIYNHYHVIQSDIKLTATSEGSNNIMGLMLTDDVSIYSNYDSMREVKPGKVLPLGQGPIPSSLTMRYNYKKQFGNLQRDDLSALYGNNCLEDMYFICWVEAATNTTVASSCTFMANITYIVESYELKDLGSS